MGWLYKNRVGCNDIYDIMAFWLPHL